MKTQTNLYAQQYSSANTDLPEYSRHRKWVDVTIPEIEKFIALYLLTGISQKPKIGQYCSTNLIIRTSFFNEVTARNCFQSILEFLHFNDNSGYQPNDPQKDRLHKIRPVVEDLVNKFKTVYKPEKHVSIDEELLLWKGCLGFKQYIPNKRAGFGIKMF